MDSPWLRYLAAGVAFLLIALGGIVLLGNFTDFDTAVNTFPLITAIAVLGAGIAYAVAERLQTGRVDSVARQFGTRTIVLMPIAIAINIILGAAVANALRVPVYLDSIGTILVGALAGPIPGALTGLVANLLWQYIIPPPFQGSVAGAFAIVAAAIGLLAGIFGRAGFLRPRPARSTTQLLLGGLVALAVVAALAVFTYTRFYEQTFTFFDPEMQVEPIFVVLGWLIGLMVVLAIAGFFALLLIRRDLSVAFVVVAGALTGVVAAVISAPISANLFGGVTGAGTDFLVAFFRQQGADVLEAAFQQGLISDPIDKVITFFVVYLILSAMARRTKARFPQGERLLNTTPEEGPA